MRNTFLPCSVGIVDVRNPIARIYAEAEKKRWQKARAMRYEMALAVGSRRWLMFCLVCRLSYSRLMLLVIIDVVNIIVVFPMSVPNIKIRDRY